ncbi:MAG: hypothetical protein MJ025_05815 [Victivallaceae bacterium]|nr:hypothetical protein [Victivallaceae bacterium]
MKKILSVMFFAVSACCFADGYVIVDRQPGLVGACCTFVGDCCVTIGRVADSILTYHPTTTVVGAAGAPAAPEVVAPAPVVVPQERTQVVVTKDATLIQLPSGPSERVEYHHYYSDCCRGHRSCPSYWRHHW